MPFIPRPIEHADIPQVLALWNELVQAHAEIDPIFHLVSTAESIFEGYLVNRLNDSMSFGILAANGSDIAGYCLASIREKPPIFAVREHGYITDLAVTPPHRRKGIGESLFLCARQWIASKGIHRIELRTISRNPSSNAFWKKMGFTTYAEDRYLNTNTAEQGAAANPYPLRS